MAFMGFVLIALGVSVADSGSLIIPTVLVFSGALLLGLYQKGVNRND